MSSLQHLNEMSDIIYMYKYMFIVMSDITYMKYICRHSTH